MAELLITMWLLLPTYIPNNVAVIVGGGPPLDRGLMLRGRRLLGDGKTARGALGGAVAGTVVAVGLNALRPALEPLMGPLPQFPPLVTVALPVGAIMGDIMGSFLKRRGGFARGAAIPVLDQLDFLIGATVLTLILAPGWLFRTVTPTVALFAIVLTPLLHRIANIVAFRLGLKQEPH